jgi:hypothetical protein
MSPSIDNRDRADCVYRREIAGSLPFFMRAWWLRDRVENEDIVFGDGDGETMPLWSSHSDPMCDASNVDTMEI